MSYIDKTLLAGEHIVYRAKIHWFIYVKGVFLCALGIYLYTYPLDFGYDVIPVIGIVIFVWGLYALLTAWFFSATTDLAVTSKRVIAKREFIRRNTLELNHSQVESFRVNQGIFGRIFGFGTVVVNGTGGAHSPIPKIGKPLEFRREAMQTIDASQSGAVPRATPA